MNKYIFYCRPVKWTLQLYCFKFKCNSILMSHRHGYKPVNYVRRLNISTRANMEFLIRTPYRYIYIYIYFVYSCKTRLQKHLFILLRVFNLRSDTLNAVLLLNKLEWVRFIRQVNINHGNTHIQASKHILTALVTCSALKRRLKCDFMLKRHRVYFQLCTAIKYENFKKNRK